MAKLISGKTNNEIEIPRGESIKTYAEELGVPFGCNSGVCGTCMINIVSGEENLNDLTEEEKALKRDKKHRLACQCKIEKGDVKIGF